MRSLLIVATAWFVGALLCGCDGESAARAPSLSITPSTLSSAITQPTVFSAVLVNSTDEVSWTVSAADPTAPKGKLSDTTGFHVTYLPPQGTAMATLTATAGSLTASVQIASAPPSKNIPGLTAAVTVRYDAQDVPHIQCAATLDCIAVQGYLQARDRWFPMDFLRHVARGKVAELIGAAGLAQDVQFRTFFTTRDGKRLEGEIAKALDPVSKAQLDAFAAGVNAYLGEFRAANGPMPGEYAQLPFPIAPGDIADWTIQDTIAIARLNQFQLSESLNAEIANGQFASTFAALDPAKIAVWIRAAAPTGQRAHTLSDSAQSAPQESAAASHAQVLPRKVQRAIDLSKWRGALAAVAANMTALREQIRPADATVGSNNWVVAGAKSATGKAMVANDPHLALQYPPLFHLSVLQSTNPGDHLNLTGGSFPGVPGALVGRGEHVGWGVTVVGYDVTDAYRETFPATADCPAGTSHIPCVKFKGVNVSMIPAPQTFLVRVGAGASGLVNAGDPAVRTANPGLPAVPPAVLVVPHHGPVIQAPATIGQDNFTGGTGVSFRWTGHEPNTRDFKAYYGLNTAADVDAAMTALKDYATGAQNFVLADDQGHIGYDPHALVPIRRFAVKGAPPQISPWFPLPGDGTDGMGHPLDLEWGDGISNCAAPAGAPASCWIDDNTLPHGTNPSKGYYFTANADPIGVSDDNDPLPDPAVATDPPYMSFDWDDSSGFRATRIQERIEAALAVGNHTVSQADMESIQADHVSRPGLAFAPAIAAIPTDDTSPPQLVAAKQVIAQWVTNGADCPSGVVGTDPKGPADTNATVLQNSAGCFLFHATLRLLITNVFADDLAVAKQRVNALAAIKALLFMLPLDPTSPSTPVLTTFCNDVDATGHPVNQKSCVTQLATALVTAYSTLAASLGSNTANWTWGRVHTIHPVSLLSLVTTSYQPGPYARPGGAFTVDVGTPSATATGLDFSYTSGGNVRHISLMDPAAPKVRMQLPGPERDGPVVSFGPDLLGQWVKNTYFDYAFGDQINNATVSIQVFKTNTAN